MKKVIELRTMEDIFNTINEKNLHSFLEDFGNFLSLRVNTMSVAKAFGVEVKDEPVMKWIDDGKNDISVNINIVHKE